MATPERSELKEGARQVREVLNAFPADSDGPEDAVVRKVAEGISDAAEMVSEEQSGAEQDAR